MHSCDKERSSCLVDRCDYSIQDLPFEGSENQACVLDVKDSTACALPDFALANFAYISDHKHEAIDAAACPFYLWATGCALLSYDTVKQEHKTACQWLHQTSDVTFCFRISCKRGPKNRGSTSMSLSSCR